MVNKGVIYIGDVSGNLGTINASGQLRVEAAVSIPPVSANVSGNSVYLPNDGVNNVVSISGQTVVASVNVAANVSGNTIYTVNDGVRNIVQISGQTVVTNVVSGFSTTRDISGSVTNISGNHVSVSGIVSVNSLPVISISGNAIQISGQTVAIAGGINVSGSPVRISGETIYLVSGNNTVQISGQTVAIAGGINVSGSPVRVSGETIYLVNDSVNNVTKISGQLVSISGSVAINNVPNVIISGGALSGLPVTGSFTASISGQPVLISGQTVVASVTTNISGQTVYTVSGQNRVQITDTSGNQLSSISGFLRVSISGQPVTTSVSVATDISGQIVVAQIRDATSSEVVEVFPNTDDDAVPTSLNTLFTSALLYGFNKDEDVISKVRMTGSGDGYRLMVTISGQPVTGSFAASVSGQPVRISGQSVRFTNDGVNNVVSISGQLVAISGEISVSVSNTPNVDANVTMFSGVNDVQISGQTIRFTNDGVNNVVSISGQTVVASISLGATPTSGDASRISGQTIYIIDDSINNKVKISGQLVAVSGIVNIGNSPVVLVSGQTVSVSGIIRLDPAVPQVSGDAIRISGQTVYLVDDSINNKVKISGQLVAVSGIVNIGNSLTIATLPVISNSGNAMLISGQLVAVSGIVAVNSLPVISVSGSTVRLPNDGVNNVVWISGQVVTATVSLGATPTSGDAARVSGQVIYLVDDSINNKVKISGQLVAVSGIVNIGNATIAVTLPASAISGNVVAVSGTVQTLSGSVTQISGQSVRWANDGVNNVIQISGQTVVASVVTNISGQFVIVSGAVTTLLGSITNVSGATVSVSGIVNIGNAPTVLISGGINVSGNAVKVSGETVSVSGIVAQRIPTAMRTRPLLQCTSLSGGTQLLSGDVRIATLINAGTSGTVMYVGSTTDPPFSGKGIYLTAGNGYTCEIDNFNRLWAFAATSGQFLSYGGTQY